MPKVKGVLYIFSKSQWFFLFVAFIVFLGITWPSSFYFLNDDLIHIPLAASGKIGHHNSIRYVGDISLILDAKIFQNQAWGYHLTNLLIHLANTLVFILLLFRILIPNKVDSLTNWAVLYSSVFFMVNGLHSEAIFWIIGRSASLAVFFFLCTVYVMFKNWKQEWLGTTLLSISWLLALFSYESVWFFPILISIAYFLLKGNSEICIRLRDVFFIWGLFIVYLCIRLIVTGDWLGTYEARHYQEFHVYQLFFNYAKLLIRTFFPPVTVPLFHLIIGLLVAIISIVGLIKMRNKIRIAAPGYFLLMMGWAISYIPYLSLGIGVRTIESERFLYLPSLFFVVFIIFNIKNLCCFRGKALVFHFLSVGFIVWHLFLLADNAHKYAASGELVKDTYRALAKANVSDSDSLYLNNLPRTIKGVPVFRIGFEDGHRWLLGTNPGIMAIDSIDAYDNLYPVIKKNRNIFSVNFRPLSGD